MINIMIIMIIIVIMLMMIICSSMNYMTMTKRRHHLTMDMAPYKKARSQNVPGNFFVDESCIDCDVCRWMSPNTFGRKGIKAAVISQPITEQGKLQAFAAMIACPVGAIRTKQSDSLVLQAASAFPAEIDHINIPDVYHLGYHSSESFGATPYLIYRSKEDGGNIMIDCPRYNSNLGKQLDEFGGIDTLIITHKDDIPEHDKWKKRYPNMQRIIHRTDAIKSAEDIEIKLEGTGQWTPSKNVTIIHTPGHTAGSLSILYKTTKENVLFTGDHLAFSGSKKCLVGYKEYNQGNIQIQSESIKMLADDEYIFNWILPAHGRMVRFATQAEKKKAVLKAVKDFDNEDEFDGILGIGYS